MQSYFISMKLQIQVFSLIQKNHSILSLLSMFEDYDENDFDEVFIKSTFDQQFKSIRKSLKLKLGDFGVFV